MLHAFVAAVCFFGAFAVPASSPPGAMARVRPQAPAAMGTPLAGRPLIGTPLAGTSQANTLRVDTSLASRPRVETLPVGMKRVGTVAVGTVAAGTTPVGTTTVGTTTVGTTTAGTTTTGTSRAGAAVVGAPLEVRLGAAVVAGSGVAVRYATVCPPGMGSYGLGISIAQRTGRHVATAAGSVREACGRRAREMVLVAGGVPFRPGVAYALVWGCAGAGCFEVDPILAVPVRFS